MTERSVFLCQIGGSFALGAFFCSVLSLFALFAVPKIGIAPAAGILFLLGTFVGLRLGIKLAIWGQGESKDLEKADAILTAAAFEEVLGVLGKYDKDTAIYLFEKKLKDAREKVEKLLIPQDELCEDCEAEKESEAEKEIDD